MLVYILYIRICYILIFTPSLAPHQLPDGVLECVAPAREYPLLYPLVDPPEDVPGHRDAGPAPSQNRESPKYTVDIKEVFLYLSDR